MDLDARQYFLDLEWLRNIVGPAGFKGAQLVGLVGKCSHEDHRNVLCRPGCLEPPADFKSIQKGHHDIEEDNIRSPFASPHQRFFAVSCLGNVVAGGVKFLIEEFETTMTGSDANWLDSLRKD